MGMICEAHSSVADLSIILREDYFELDLSVRINKLSVSSGNWNRQIDAKNLTSDLAKEIARMTLIYGRVCNEE